MDSIDPNRNSQPRLTDAIGNSSIEMENPVTVAVEAPGIIKTALWEDP